MAKRFRWMLVVLIVLTLGMPACAPTVAQPTATPEPSIQPAATAAPAQPMILVLPGYNQKSLIAVNRHYSTVLKSKGWNIDFYTVNGDIQLDSKDNAVDPYLKYVTTQLAAGIAKADGYFPSGAQIANGKQTFDDLRSKGLLFDCSQAAQKAAPDYWARWKDRIANSPYGLPLCREIGGGVDYMLCVRQDMVGEVTKPPNTFSDIRVLVDRLAGPALKDDTQATANPTDPVRGSFRLVAGFRDWLNCWVLEQGYMAIDEGTFVYVGIDDVNAQPVLLEDIPGFAAFVEDYLSLHARGVIIEPTWTEGTPSSQGNALLLQTYYLLQPEQSGFTIQDCLAYPLYRGGRHARSLWIAFLREHPDHLFTDVLTIPAASRRAADAMAFVQWATASQENADALLYGQLGEDYTLQGERVALSARMRAIMNGSFDESNSGAFSIHRQFDGFVKGRISVEAPRNAEDVLAAAPPQTLAAPWLTDLMTYRLAFYSIPVEGEEVPPENLTQGRYNDLQPFFDLLYFRTDNTGTLPTSEELLKGFHGKDSDTLLQWYRQRVDKARAKAGQ